MTFKKSYTVLFAILAAVTVLAVSLSPSTGNAALQAVSPDNVPVGQPHVGYPLWYRDFTGLSLKPCIDPVGGPAGVCVGLPAPGATADQPEFEDFYWIMEASGPGGAVLPSGAFYRAALEMATFSNPLLPGGIERTLFFRVRIRFNATLPGDYTVTHPFGTHIFRNVPVGIRAINDTIDLGLIANDFVTVLSAFGAILDIDEGRVPASILLGSANAFPTWAGLPAPPAGYIGNFAVPHAVTDVGAGAVFSITGPGTNISTDQFFLAGQIFAPANRPPVITMDNNVFPPITAGPGAIVTRTATYSDPDNNALSTFTAILTPTPVDNTWFTATRLDNVITITINPALIPATDNNKAFIIDMHATDTGIPPLLGHNHPTFTVGTVAAPAVVGAGGGGGGGCAVAGVGGDWKDLLGGLGLLALVAIGLRFRKRSTNT